MVTSQRVLESEAKTLIPKEIHPKIDPTRTLGWLVEYPDNVKDWRIWFPNQRKVLFSRDVVFNETRFIGDSGSLQAAVKHYPCEQLDVFINTVVLFQQPQVVDLERHFFSPSI